MMAVVGSAALRGHVEPDDDAGRQPESRRPVHSKPLDHPDDRPLANEANADQPTRTGQTNEVVGSLSDRDRGSALSDPPRVGPFQYGHAVADARPGVVPARHFQV